MKKDSKQRLFEVMQRLDKTFKTTLNEEINNEPFRNLKYEKSTQTIRTVPENYWIATVTDDGEIVFDSWDGAIRGRVDKDYVINWFNDNVKNAGLDEGRRFKVNPKYTHFAVFKDSNKIATAWEYGDIEPEELRSEKKHYFFNDLVDWDIDPKSVNILSRKYLERKGINPFDWDNWETNEEREARAGGLNEVRVPGQARRDLVGYMSRVKRLNTNNYTIPRLRTQDLNNIISEILSIDDWIEQASLINRAKGNRQTHQHTSIDYVIDNAKNVKYIPIDDDKKKLSVIIKNTIQSRKEFKQDDVNEMNDKLRDYFGEDWNNWGTNEEREARMSF